MSDDTAEKTATIAECLYSNGNRIEIARILLGLDRTDLLNTVLEDLFFHIQNMVDEYCVVRDSE